MCYSVVSFSIMFDTGVVPYWTPYAYSVITSISYLFYIKMLNQLFENYFIKMSVSFVRALILFDL